MSSNNLVTPPVATTSLLPGKDTKLFEAFFWIEPQRQHPSQPFSSTRISWHYPKDISALCGEFKDIPFFCYPDLDALIIEKVESTKIEHFIFTLTDGDGTRVYGICLRSFNQGVMRRYDVTRRVRDCLCIITRRPYFSFFRTLLLQIHALALIDRSSTNTLPSAIVLLQSAYNTSDMYPGKHVIVPHSLVPSLVRDFHLVIPRDGLLIHKETPLLPLMEILGVDKFMLILSAALCERKLLFVGDHVTTVSSSVLSMVSMLHPFIWQHILIPILPAKLLDFASSPIPFIIGMKRYLLPRLLAKNSLEGCIIIDVDSGECTLQGDVVIKDFVGESGTALKQATDSLDRVVGKASVLANTLFRSAGGKVAEVTDTGPKDVLVVMLQDLRGMMANKPGASGLQAVLRTAQGKSTDSIKDRWAPEAERLIRQNLLLFYVYLFADMDDCLRQPPVGSTKAPFQKPSTTAVAAFDGFATTTDESKGTTIPSKPQKPNASSGNSGGGKGDSRSSFNLHLFLHRRGQMGDSRSIMEFLTEFQESQMFERFCAYRMQCLQNTNKHTSTAWYGSNVNPEEVDEYSAACMELKNKNAQATVLNVKSAVKLVYTEDQRSPLSNTNNTNMNEVYDPISSYYHPNTLNITASGSEFVTLDEVNSTFLQICRDCYGNSEVLLKILRTINMRVEEVRANIRNNSLNRVVGLRLIELMRYLVIFGPHAIASDFCDNIQSLRYIGLDASKITSSLRDVELRMKVNNLVQLLLDHQLLEQTRQRENASNPFKNCYSRGPTFTKKNLLLVTNSNRVGDFRFPDFKKLHAALSPKTSWPPSTCVHAENSSVKPSKPFRSSTTTTTVQSATSSEKLVNLLDNDDDEDNYEYAYTGTTPMPSSTVNAFDQLGNNPVHYSSKNNSSTAAAAVDPFDDPFLAHIIDPQKPTTTTTGTSDISVTTTPHKQNNVFDPKVRSALDTSPDPFYPVLNKNIPVNTNAAASGTRGFDGFGGPGGTSSGQADPFASALNNSRPVKPPLPAGENPFSADLFAAVLQQKQQSPQPPAKPMQRSSVTLNEDPFASLSLSNMSTATGSAAASSSSLMQPPLQKQAEDDDPFAAILSKNKTTPVPPKPAGKGFEFLLSED